VDFIFQDEAFKFETLRAAGFAGDAGADIGEVIVTTAQIPAHVAAELRAPHEHVVMRSADGAGAHCHEGAMYLLHQTIFNYLAKTLG